MMIDLDEAQSTILTAAAKVYSALRVANPAYTFNSELVVVLNIDGFNYNCRCDSVGVIQTIIRVMGYQPNWGSSPISSHIGDGWFLSDATSRFVQDRQGNISTDWEVLEYDASDVRPGDIRASKSHSRCDILVGIADNRAMGLGSGSNLDIQLSCTAGSQFLIDNNAEQLLATDVIPNSDVGKVLRYVRGVGQSISSSVVQLDSTQSLHSIEVELKFRSKLRFIYKLPDSELKPYVVNMGYFPKTCLYPVADRTANDTYGDCWLTFFATYSVTWSDQPEDEEWKEAVRNGLLMLFTLDGSDPFVTGRTVYLKDDGTNDYERSKGWVPCVKAQFPVYFRCVLTDPETRTKEYGRSSAYITNDTSGRLVNISNILANSQFLEDASGDSPECEDAHGYLFINDIENLYDKGIYSPWIDGVEE